MNSPGVVAPERDGLTHAADGDLDVFRRPRPRPSRSGTGRGGPSVTLVALVAVCLMGLVFATQSARSPDPDHGDWWSDMETLHAAQRLVDTGFITGKLSTPLDDGAELGVPAYLYTNWPPGSTLATAAALRAGLGPIGARALPLVLSAATATLLFLWMRALLRRGDAAFLAMLWLVTASPFRLLSDSYTYQPWDLFGRALALWLITEAVLRSGQQSRSVRTMHLAAIAAAPALSVAVLGLETVPGTLLYGLLLPLLFVPAGVDGSIRARVARTIGIVAALATGFVVGLTIRLAQAAWVFGGLGEAMRHLRAAGEFRLRTSSDQFTNGYLAEWAMRMGRYLLPAVIVGGLTVVVALIRFARAAPAVRRQWMVATVSVGVPLLAAEVVWPLVARQHSHQHIHTIMHLLFSTSVVCGLGCAWALRWARARLGERAALGVAALLVVPFIVNWVVFPRNPYGNVAEKVAWKKAVQAMGVLDDAAGSSRYVDADRSANATPVGLYFLGRPYLRSDNPLFPDRPADPTVVHLATTPPPTPSRVLAEQAGFLVYDPASTGSSPADLVAGAQLDHALIGILSNTAIEGIIFQPWLGGDHASATIPIPTGAGGTLSVHVFKSSSAGDGASMAIRFTDGADTESYELAMYQEGEATPVSFALPASGPGQLTIEVDCGPSRNCDSDELGVAFAITRSP